MGQKKTYTVESVTSGHPDKVCDQISDAILDAYLGADPYARVAVETFGSHNLLVIGGEVTSTADIDPIRSRTQTRAPATSNGVDAAEIARELYRDIGYNDSLTIITNIVQQSPDIALGVDTGGAGDQGIMYGYATNETKTYMPKAVVAVHELTRGLERLRREDSECAWLGPDGKAQITVRDGAIMAILVSAQHAESVSQEEIKKTLTEKLIQPIIGNIHEKEILINPTGKFTVGGFAADTGLTGRKIMVDTYCGLIPHGGGAFSGKDPTKVDRSAAYMARFAAKNIVANGHADDCMVSVAYAIGKEEPLMVHAESSDGKDLSSLIKEKFDFRPRAIIERLDLRRGIYKDTASYGHFGKLGFSWEEIIKV